MALKILLADDSMTAQNMGKKILVDAGYDVVAVSNGAAAIKKMASERPDIAILDVYMPGYTGLEVCERVKASGETSKTPVLLTVGKMEAFNPEDVNRVKADGVMIKPFEASDLIAAIQSIAQRLLAPNPPQRGLDSTVQLRAPRGGSLEDTLRVPPPKASDVSHEDTIRLTAEQIKAFQDASYHDWANSAEPHLEEHEKTVALSAQEPPVTPTLEETHRITPAMSAEVGEAPAMHAASMDDAPASKSHETPVFNAMSASGVAAEHEIFTAATTPVAPVEELPHHAPAVPSFYTPPVMEEEGPVSDAPVFAVEPTPVVESVAPAIAEEVAPSSPVFGVESSPVIEAVVPVVEEAIAPSAPVLEPVMEETPAVSVVEAAPVLETSAPLTPGPVRVEQAAELEPTSAPPIEVAAVPAQELEITSPPQERGAVIAQDPALVTETEDMSQFVTTFGVEGAEPVHVGVASDLSDEQLAAIMTPMQEAAPGDVHEVPFASVTSAVEGEAPSSPIASEVGSIEAVETPESDDSVVAYVPEPDQTQQFYVAPQAPAEPEPVVEAASAPVVEASTQAPVVESVPEPEPVSETPAPVAEAAPAVVEQPAAVEAVAAAPSHVEEPVHSEHHAAILQAVEAAVAAAAGTAATAAVAHVVHMEPARVHEPVPPVVPEPPAVEHVEPHHETFGDAALAEELAAAMSAKAPEEHSTSVAEEMPHPEAAAPHYGANQLSDTKLADAVARAFESLKPHLITEIIKELSK